MLLGLSGSQTDDDIRPEELRTGAGVPHGELLVRFVDAAFDSPEELAAVRDEVVETMGMDSMIDAAAVISNFHMMTRIADGTGTPLDEFTAAMSGDMREALGLNDMVSSRFQSG